jgi:O-antigen ligase
LPASEATGILRLLLLATTQVTHGNHKLAAVGIAALMAGTIFLSGSRTVMLAFALQAVVLAVLLRSQQRNWRQIAILGVCLAAIIGFLIWVGGNEPTRRLASIHAEAQQELFGGVRLTMDRDCLRMWRAKPWFGVGARHLSRGVSSIPNLLHKLLCE